MSPDDDLMTTPDLMSDYLTMTGAAPAPMGNPQAYNDLSKRISDQALLARQMSIQEQNKALNLQDAPLQTNETIGLAIASILPSLLGLAAGGKEGAYAGLAAGANAGATGVLNQQKLNLEKSKQSQELANAYRSLENSLQTRADRFEGQGIAAQARAERDANKPPKKTLQQTIDAEVAKTTTTDTNKTYNEKIHSVTMAAHETADALEILRNGIKSGALNPNEGLAGAYARKALNYVDPNGVRYNLDVANVERVLAGMKELIKGNSTETENSKINKVMSNEAGITIKSLEDALEAKLRGADRTLLVEYDLARSNVEGLGLGDGTNAKFSRQPPQLIGHKYGVPMTLSPRVNVTTDVLQSLVSQGLAKPFTKQSKDGPVQGYIIPKEDGNAQFFKLPN